MIMSDGLVVDCVARLSQKGIKVNLLNEIQFRYQKKTVSLTRQDSPTQQALFQKDGNALIALE